MESDSKDVVKTGSDGQLKDDLKGPSKSKRSNRKKKSELPPILLPKFPSQKQLKKKNSDDKMDRKEDDESTPMCPSDKAIEDGDDMIVVEKHEEQEEEQVDDTQDYAPPEQPIVEENPKKPAPEKPPIASDKKVRTDRSQMKPRVKEGLSGRSQNRKTRKLAAPTDKADSKRRSGLNRRPSCEDLFSEDGKDGRKSMKRSIKINTRKRGNQQKAPPEPQNPPNPNPNPADSPDAKPDRSLRNAVPEKSTDEKGKRANTPQPVAQTPPSLTPNLPPPIHTPPPPGVFPSLKKDQKEQGSAPKSQIGMSSSNRFDPAAKKKKKKRGFLKNVYKKTKFWGRKSDCVADPTTEMLAKSYVPPEYDAKNKRDFLPEVKTWFAQYKEDDMGLRAKTNPCSGEKEIFLNNRPFWLTPQPDDEAPPKVRIQMHRPLKLLFAKNTIELLPKYSRPANSFLDPKITKWKSLKQIDKSIGVEDSDSARMTREAKEKAKENELKRVTANTFHSTVMFEEEKLRNDEKKKEHDSKDAKKDTDCPKSSLENEPPSAKRVAWKPHESIGNNDEMKKLQPGEYIQKLYLYNRKNRPTPKIPTAKESAVQPYIDVNQFIHRDFKAVHYTMGKARILRKPVVTPTQSAASVSSKSATVSSSMEDNKK